MDPKYAFINSNTAIDEWTRRSEIPERLLILETAPTSEAPFAIVVPGSLHVRFNSKETAFSCRLISCNCSLKIQPLSCLFSCIITGHDGIHPRPAWQLKIKVHQSELRISNRVAACYLIGQGPNLASRIRLGRWNVQV